MLDLTPSEKRTILIISGTLILAGLFYKFQSYTITQQSFDYSQSDSIFSRLSIESPLSVNSDNNTARENMRNSNMSTEISQTVEEVVKGSININKADVEELEKLPRIGPAMAKRIIEYRKLQGSFKSLDDLIKVKGIGQKTLDLIRPYLEEIR
jgi:comEA protein